MENATQESLIDNLQAELAKFQELNAYNQDGLFLIQEETVKYCNKALASILGYTVEEMIGQKFIYFIVPEHRPMVFSRYRARQEGQPMPEKYEIKLLHKDKKTQIVCLIFAGLIKYQGKISTIGSIKNLTSQKLIEHELKQSERKYRRLVETSIVGIVISDFNDNITFTNARFSQMLQYSQSELLEMNVSELSSIKGYKLIQGKTKKRINGVSEAYQVQLITKKGKIIDVLVNASPFRDENGKIIATMGVVLDISEDMHIQRALEKSEKHYRNLIENTLVGIAQTDFDENIIFCNKYFAEMLGYKPSDLSGVSLSEITPNHEFQQFHQRTEQRKTGLADIYESTLIRKNGRLLRVIVNAYPHFNDEDEIDGTMGLILDITEYSEIEERFHGLFMNLPNIVFFVSTQGKIVDANPAACSYLGYTQYELIGMNFSHLLHSEFTEIFNSKFIETSEERSSFVKLKVFKKNNQIVDIEFNMFLGDSLRNPVISLISKE